jgi:3-polyprenyl-4-hydroxybenzoate decarboxylase
VARESPFSTIHLRNLYEISQMGAIVLPPMLTYYNHPKSLEDCNRHVVNRILSQFDLDEDSYQWEGMDETV